MLDVDVLKAESVSCKNGIATCAASEGTVRFELDLPDSSPRRVGIEEIAFPAEGQAVGYQGLRSSGICGSSGGRIDCAGRQGPNVSADRGHAAAEVCTKFVIRCSQGLNAKFFSDDPRRCDFPRPTQSGSPSPVQRLPCRSNASPLAPGTNPVTKSVAAGPGPVPDGTGSNL